MDRQRGSLRTGCIGSPVIAHDIPIADEMLAKFATSMRVNGLIALEHTLLTDASLPVIADAIPARA